MILTNQTRRAVLGGGIAMAALAATAPRAAAQSISLNFNFGTPGYHVGFWAPTPYYRQYYTPSLYAQYVMWFYYPSEYYRYYYAPPPPRPYGVPLPPRPPRGAPRPPPPDRFFNGLRVPRPQHYHGAPHLPPGREIPRWRPAFQPPGPNHGGHRPPPPRGPGHAAPPRRPQGQQRPPGPNHGSPQRGQRPGPDRGPGRGKTPDRN